MKTLVILVAMVTCVCGRPAESSGGYTYDKPNSGYIYENPSRNTNTLPHRDISVNFKNGESSLTQEANFGINTEFTSRSGANVQESSFTHSTDESNFGVSVVASNLEPIIKKSYYLHVAPEEAQSKQAKTRFIQSAPEIHYRVIFVKVPSQVQQRQTEVILPPKIEEKTVVYVLVKRPKESSEQVRIPNPEPAKPSQPEVFFVKYKTEKKIKGNIEGVSGADILPLSGDSKTEDEVNLDIAETDGIGSFHKTGLDVVIDGSGHSSVTKTGLQINTSGDESSEISENGIPQQLYGNPN